MNQRDTVRLLSEDSGFQARFSALGYGNEPMSGTAIMDLVHPDDAGPLIKRAEQESREGLEELEITRQVAKDPGRSFDLQETVYDILEHTRQAIPYDKATPRSRAGTGSLPAVTEAGTFQHLDHSRKHSRKHSRNHSRNHREALRCPAPL